MSTVWYLIGHDNKAYQVIDATHLRNVFGGHAVVVDDFVDRANSVSFGIGRQEQEAWLLIYGSDADGLATSQATTKENKIRIIDDNSQKDYSGWFIDNAASQVIHFENENAAYLCRLVDARSQLKWSTLKKSFNVAMKAPYSSDPSSASHYYTESLNTESLNSGSLWTWQTMLNEIWTNFPTSKTSPTLPRSVDGKPINFMFNGVNAWDAYNDILAHLSMAFAIAENGDFSIVDLAAASTTTSPLFNGQYDSYQVYQNDSVVGDNIFNVEKVSVFFKIFEKWHGSEKDSPRNDNFLIDSVYEIATATGLSGARVKTKRFVHDDMPAYRNESGTITNLTEITARAEEITEKISSAIENLRSGNFKRWYGFVPCTLSSRLNWYRVRDFGLSDPHTAGLMTEATCDESMVGAFREKRYYESESTPESFNSDRSYREWLTSVF